MIDFAMTFRIAVRALRVHKLRSLLTMLGIIIGVGAVVAMVSVGQGATAQVTQRIASLGSNVLQVFPGSSTAGGVRGGSGSMTSLEIEDAEAIAASCPDVAAVAPIVQRGAQVVYGNLNWYTSVTGTSVEYLDVRSWEISEGEMFAEDDVDAGTKVCVLGRTVVENLFPDEDPVGAVLRIGNVPFTVVGVLTVKGGNEDDIILIPVKTAQRRLTGRTSINRIMVSAVSQKRTSAAQEQIGELLRARHNIRPGEEDDFTVRDMADIAAAVKQSSSVLTLLLASIASVSLLVGGIGIMNIMLVSVTERTREIGIRMAVGAKGRDVLLQFLVEAVLTSLLGGLIGILFGLGVSQLIGLLAKWNTPIVPGAILLAFVFSAVVGIFFGYYPARRAANLDPIDALRYE
ncbi:ABC transporter permease [candidate division WOR-3 bacterium]|nr:ABC transporter permease [candidate division WOR-3 bacterium]